jgi:hypothetical protein
MTTGLLRGPLELSDAFRDAGRENFVLEAFAFDRFARSDARALCPACLFSLFLAGLRIADLLETVAKEIEKPVMWGKSLDATCRTLQPAAAGENDVMIRKRTATLMILAVVAVGCVVAQSARAQSAYPERLIKMIVPAPAGGQTDVMARLMAQKMQQSLGQSVIIENRAGAGGAGGCLRRCGWLYPVLRQYQHACRHSRRFQEPGL